MEAQVIVGTAPRYGVDKLVYHCWGCSYYHQQEIEYAKGQQYSHPEGTKEEIKKITGKLKKGPPEAHMVR